MSKIAVKNITKDYRGVFAMAPIKKGEVIEVCPVVVFAAKDTKALDKTGVFDYYFLWGKKNQAAIALGSGSLYNHSYMPNAEYEQNVKTKVIAFTALRNIKKGEEITVNYNGDWDDLSPIWFKVTRP